MLSYLQHQLISRKIYVIENSINFHTFFFRNDAEPIDLQLDYWTVDSNSTGSTNLSFDSGSRVSSNLSSMTSSKLRSDHSSSRTDSKRDNSKGSEVGNKASIKTSVWFMQVNRLGVPSSEQPTFLMHYGLKEKKQKSKFFFKTNVSKWSIFVLKTPILGRILLFLI